MVEINEESKDLLERQRRYFIEIFTDSERLQKLFAEMSYDDLIKVMSIGFDGTAFTDMFKGEEFRTKEFTLSEEHVKDIEKILLFYLQISRKSKK